MKRLLYILAMLCTVAPARDPAQRADFMRSHPCPSTGKKKGACPGYVVDHIHPLCAGGADHPSNMQWQTVDEAKAKDRDDRRLCAAMRGKRTDHGGR